MEKSFPFFRAFHEASNHSSKTTTLRSCPKNCGLPFCPFVGLHWSCVFRTSLSLRQKCNFGRCGSRCKVLKPFQTPNVCGVCAIIGNFDFMQECRLRESHTQECPARVSYKNVIPVCPARVLRKSLLEIRMCYKPKRAQECHWKGLTQECPTRMPPQDIASYVSKAFKSNPKELHIIFWDLRYKQVSCIQVRGFYHILFLSP